MLLLFYLLISTYWWQMGILGKCNGCHQFEHIRNCIFNYLYFLLDLTTVMFPIHIESFILLYRIHIDIRVSLHPYS